MNTLPHDSGRDLRVRLKDYGLRVLRLYDSLPTFGSIQMVGRQIARSGTSPVPNIGKHAVQNLTLTLSVRSRVPFKN
jgi:hypothetical protein